LVPRLGFSSPPFGWLGVYLFLFAVFLFLSWSGIMTVTGPYDSSKKWLGLSTDTKPTDIAVGTEFYETDTGKTFIYSGSAWIQK